MTSFKNKNVVISGASRGIGLSIAKKLAHHGANIAILAKTDVAHPKLPGTIYTAAKEIESFGVKVIPIKVNSGYFWGKNNAFYRYNLVFHLIV